MLRALIFGNNNTKNLLITHFEKYMLTKYLDSVFLFFWNCNHRLFLKYRLFRLILVKF